MRIELYGDETVYIVGTYKNKEQFIKKATEFYNKVVSDNSYIPKSSIKKGYLYGNITTKKSRFSIEANNNFKRYGKQSECFYVEEDDIEEAE